MSSLKKEKQAEAITKVFHATVIAVDILVFIFQATLIPCQLPDCGFGWWFRYLTIWGIATELIYFLIAFVSDFSVHNSQLKNHRDRMFALVFPLMTLIGVVFWITVFPFSPDIQQNSKSIFVSVWEHGVAFVFVWMELYLVKHVYGNWRMECLIILLYWIAYVLWNVLCYYVDKAWAYPFQKGMSIAASTGVFIALALILFAFYFVGRFLSQKIHRRKDYIYLQVSESLN